MENPELYCYTLNNGMEMQQHLSSDNIVNTNNSDQQGDSVSTFASVLTLFYSQQCSTFASSTLFNTLFGMFDIQHSTVLHSTLFYIQHCSAFNIVLHSFNSVRHSTLFYIQHCSAFNSVLHSTVFYIQHCSAFNSVLHSTLFCIQPCSAFNSVRHSTLFYIQHCSAFNSVLHSVGR